MFNELRIKIHRVVMGGDPVKKFVNPYTNMNGVSLQPDAIGVLQKKQETNVKKPKINIREFVGDCKDTFIEDTIRFFTPKRVVREKLLQRTENKNKYDHFVELAYGRKE